jgi:hypothetical protein
MALPLISTGSPKNMCLAVNFALGLNVFFLGNTCTILNLKICLESPKHRLFNLLKVFICKIKF